MDGKVNIFVKMCAECPTCKYTRAGNKKTVRYFFSRLAQKLCFACFLANRALKKNFQESIKE